MKKFMVVMLVAALGLAAVGCGGGPMGTALASEQPREVADLGPADLAALVDGNTEFALDLYDRLRDDDGDLFYSPLSISLALAQVYAGASGTTATEMAETLSFTLPSADLHHAFNGLDQLLAARGEGAAGQDGEGFRLNLVNAMWGQQDYHFLPEYLDTLAINYGAGLRLVDFVSAPEASRQTINDWVSEQTAERIQDLLPDGSIDSTTRMVLTNAIYFNAAWLHPFDETATVDGDFYGRDGTTARKPLMSVTEEFDYTAGPGYQAVALPYDGDELAMLVVVPDEGRFDEFEAGLDGDTLAAVREDLAARWTRLTMPKFESAGEFSLKDTLAAMGMPSAFADEADFSGITGDRSLVISDVVHKSFIAVDEAGTEAAAATGVIGVTSIVDEEPLEFRIDRPFIYTIIDQETGAVLFLGRVVG